MNLSANKRNDSMKTTQYIFLLLAIASLFAADTAWAKEGQSMNSEEILDITDLNGDGRIDIEEYRNRVTDVYFFLDNDKDGVLTVVEIQKSMPNIDPAVIDKADVNGDANITIYEFRYVLYKDFDAQDKNQDGSLDKQEMKDMMEAK
jgi:Ca2+-binding EF-hand superfamily protein